MQLNDFTIGEDFWTATGKWRCTDIGTRTVCAIKIDEDADPSWFEGPPFSVTEYVMDENDMPGCYPTAELDGEGK